ncbi:hypothetical protein AVEN_171912-1 [Araneus ventricosus]|uniref:Uncharacterized protein n=1 Tax=Araneus ventricosus TaxID=182803 RepID=A0A4Y2RBE9_ARAVE|nr:hypothetical protein AVEN_171912-1 [Araneus ventricosus]
MKMTPKKRKSIGLKIPAIKEKKNQTAVRGRELGLRQKHFKSEGNVRREVILTDLLDCSGVVHWEFLPTSQTVKKEYYLGDLRRLSEAIRR